MVGTITEISSNEAKEFLLPRHYSGRTPPITKAFGWFTNGKLQAVCTFGKPGSPAPCKGVCGEEWANNVYELNRLCREDDFHEPLSTFVSACLRKLRPLNWIILSYSDMQMNHHGYIYQATNFIYTGATNERLDRYAGFGKHARHAWESNPSDNNIRQVRSQKHRYIYFCTSNKKIKEQWMKELRFPILPYPKGDNQNYTLGEYMKPKLVNVETGKELGWEKEKCETLTDWLDRLL